VAEEKAGDRTESRVIFNSGQPGVTLPQSKARKFSFTMVSARITTYNGREAQHGLGNDSTEKNGAKGCPATQINNSVSREKSSNCGDMLRDW